MLAVGCDHGGFALKQEILDYLRKRGIPFEDVGAYSDASVDYPDYALEAVRQIRSGRCDRAVLICGTGIGISISANKYRGIRCALCCDSYMARMSREHNDANVLAMGGRVIGPGLALDIVRTWLDTPFSGEEKHVRRVGKIMAAESQAEPDNH